MFKAGLFKLVRNDTLLTAAEGEFEVNLGLPKASSVRGGDGQVKGFEYEGQDPMVSGEILVTKGLDLTEMMSPSDEGDTIAIEFQDKSIFTLEGAQYTGESKFNTKGRLSVEWIGLSASYS